MLFYFPHILLFWCSLTVSLWPDHPSTYIVWVFLCPLLCLCQLCVSCGFCIAWCIVSGLYFTFWTLLFFVHLALKACVSCIWVCNMPATQLHPDSLHLYSLHWLPVHYRIFSKILVLTYKGLNGHALDYISASYKIHCCLLSFTDSEVVSCSLYKSKDYRGTEPVDPQATITTTMFSWFKKQLIYFVLTGIMLRIYLILPACPVWLFSHQNYSLKAKKNAFREGFTKCIITAFPYWSIWLIFAIIIYVFIFKEKQRGRLTVREDT